MYWVPKSSSQPLNGQDVVTWNAFQPDRYLVAKYYDAGEEMDDGHMASLNGFYIRNKSGRRFLLRSGVSYYLPLEIPRPAEETKAKQYHRGYRAALFRTLAILEAMSKTSVGGQAWAIKDIHGRIEHEIRRTLVEQATAGKADNGVEVRDL